MPVELIQRNKNIRVNVVVDGTVLLADYAKRIQDIASQRAAGLADRESFGSDGEKIVTPLTPDQIVSVNQTHDLMIEAAKRDLQVKMLDEARKEISKSIEAAAFSVDVNTERAARKARIDQEIDAKLASTPTVDVDVIK